MSYPNNMTAQRPSADNVCAVVVTYHPNKGFVDRIVHVVSQVAHVVLIDNGSGGAATCMLQAIAESQKNIELILNADNLGIAVALNQGAQRAAELQYDWVLTLDQDSVLKPDMVKGLQNVYDTLDNEDSIGIIAANFRSRYGRKWKKIASSSNDWMAPDSVITSGSLLSVKAYHAVGKFRDDFFIDMVDREYSLRLRKLGYKLYMSTRPLMTHAIGTQTQHKLCGITVIALNHSISRRYYIARNRLVMARLYFVHYPSVVLRDLKNMVIESLVIILYESDKRNKLRAIMIGICDAMKGRMGKKEGLPGVPS